VPTGSHGGSALLPLRYAPGTVDGMQVLAHDLSGPGRIVEVFGNLGQADHLAIVVPGNAHDLTNYRNHTGGASPRRNGIALHEELRDRAPRDRCAVIVWLGYPCPRGFLAGARRDAAEVGARDLRTLVSWLPDAARTTVIGHSYGSLVAAAAAAGESRIDDLVALASPGLGVWHVGELGTGARVWATRHPRDWVRFFPRARIGGVGHGRQPTDPGFGAEVFASDAGGDGRHARPAGGHDTYYRRGGEALRNLVRIVVGAHAEVTRPRYPGGGTPELSATSTRVEARRANRRPVRAAAASTSKA
jgi:pimeloyl-ACP methyl ester carboxylesterase